MTFTIENLLESIAEVLGSRYPDYSVYTSTNQQGTKFPCFFIFFMTAETEGQIDDRYLRDLGIDIVLVQQRNIVNGNTELLLAAEFLDEALEAIPYRDGSGQQTPIHTFERQWKIEDGELHYQFHIRQRVSLPRETIQMQEMEENHVSVEGKQKKVR